MFVPGLFNQCSTNVIGPLSRDIPKEGLSVGQEDVIFSQGTVLYVQFVPQI